MVKKRGSKHKAINRRAGRTLKMGVRAPSGRLSQAADAAPREDVRAVVWRQREQHQGLEGDKARSAYAATLHGVMMETGRLTKAQYEVCERYGRVRRRWERIIGGPSMTNGASCYGEQPGGVDWLEDEDEVQKAREAYLSMCARFKDYRTLLVTVNDVVCKGEEPAHWKVFTRALEMLAEHWGMEMENGD